MASDARRRRTLGLTRPSDAVQQPRQRQRAISTGRIGGRRAVAPWPDPRKIFVAYPYDFPEADYRRPFNDLSKAFNVRFEFADEQITSQHLLNKVTKMILTSRFSLFDITSWNPNVTLELGVAVGQRRPYYLLFNPSHHQPDAPADLAGLDRIQYGSYFELESGLTKLLVQELGVPQEAEREAEPMEALRTRVLAVTETQDGPKIGEIAEALSLPLDFAKAVVRQMVEEGELETTGQTRGTRYYPSGHAR